MCESKGTKRKEEKLVLTLLPFRGVGGTGGEAKWRKRKGEKKEKKKKKGKWEEGGEKRLSLFIFVKLNCNAGK